MVWTSGIRHPIVGAMGFLRSSLLWASENRTIEAQFRKRRFAKAAVSRFMPGETLDDALRECRSLAEHGVSSVVTLLGEMVSGAEAVQDVVRRYANALETARAQELDTHVSVKLTHLGLDLGGRVARDAVAELVRQARRAGSFLWVDMEHSRYVDRTLDIVNDVWAAEGPLGVCLQAYLYRTARDLDELSRQGVPIRLVKGAYDEPDNVAMPKKADVDRHFYELALQLIERYSGEGPPPGLATHDLALIEKIQADLPGSATASYEVQMLYGIQRVAQRRLAQQGVPVRVLVSYGEAWFPWYVRRLAERPANLGFVLRSMLGT